MTIVLSERSCLSRAANIRGTIQLFAGVIPCRLRLLRCCDVLVLVNVADVYDRILLTYPGRRRVTTLLVADPLQQIGLRVGHADVLFPIRQIRRVRVRRAFRDD